MYRIRVCYKETGKYEIYYIKLLIEFVEKIRTLILDESVKVVTCSVVPIKE